MAMIFKRNMLAFACVSAVVGIAHAQPGFPVMGADKDMNLVMNASQIFVNGADLVESMSAVKKQSNNLDELNSEISVLQTTQASIQASVLSTITKHTTDETALQGALSDVKASQQANVQSLTQLLNEQTQVSDTLRKELEDLRAIVNNHLSLTNKPTNSPTRSPITAPTPAPGFANLKINWNGKKYSQGDTLAITGGVRMVQEIVVQGFGTVEIEAFGAKGGNGNYQLSDASGAPGGSIKIRTVFNYPEPTTLYAFVAETGIDGDVKNDGRTGGAGGGSTDLRSVYNGTLKPIVGTDLAFYNAFIASASLKSRLIVAGGGGGAHGGSYGYWGDPINHPGAGGPNRTYTNCGGGNDAAFVNCGATTQDPGIDGGSSVSAQYTGSGGFGMGGQSSDGVMNGVYDINAKAGYTGMSWPNGGSGTTWVNGGGGGGWYGGAGNWPNGGGGSNFNTVGSVLSDLGAVNNASGMLKITLISHKSDTLSPTTSPTGTTTMSPTPAFHPIMPPTKSPLQDTAITIVYNGAKYQRGNSFKIVGGPTSRQVHQIQVSGAATVEIEACGAVGGAGNWNGANQPGAPGGCIKISTKLDSKQTPVLYAFVAEAGVPLAGGGGSGGGSSDIRTYYEGSLTSVTDLDFYTAVSNFTSLTTRLLVGGGGGGAHGGGYGYWGDPKNHPGAGGPNRTYTNCGGDNDASYTNCGATTVDPGLDGGSSVSAAYTGSGSFGMGGQASDGQMDGVYSGVRSGYSGMGWPNGGSGTRFANGGGGGGWFGGAGNWPNGGGGSNNATVGNVIFNTGASNNGAGYITVTIR
eukprot:m.147564 g.147564  ORF g.147564 m.147564 type:complete len:804 (+) comp30544_c0_seq1:198-2609(+)